MLKPIVNIGPDINPPLVHWNPATQRSNPGSVLTLA